MNGLTLGKKNDYIEKVEKKTEKLSLLAKGENIEVMKQTIRENVLFLIDPGDDENLIEFFYVIDGVIVYEVDNNKITLEAGDYFYVRNLKDTVFFRTITEVSMLYVANQPVFHFLSDEIKKVTEMRIHVEKKDMYTHEHGLRLQDYALIIGEKLHMTKAQLSVLCYGASFHDLGKINVPDEVLMKPGRLTKEEFDLIKKHPEDGAKIIEGTFLKDSSLAILQHHERLDGSGYPYGLKGEEICIEAKIIGVVDTYDAMTSDRPYRKGMEAKVAFGEIKSLVGKHYDKKVVECLEEILKEDGVI